MYRRTNSSWIKGEQQKSTNPRYGRLLHSLTWTCTDYTGYLDLSYFCLTRIETCPVLNQKISNYWETSMKWHEICRCESAEPAVYILQVELDERKMHTKSMATGNLMQLLHFLALFSPLVSTRFTSCAQSTGLLQILVAVGAKPM